MKRIVIIAIIVAAAIAGVAFYTGMFSRANTAQAQGAQAAGGPGGGGGAQGGRQGGGGGRGGFGGFGGGGGRGQMTVELAPATRAEVDQELTVVGSLIGDATVAVAPKTAGRLQDVYVKLGDRVNRGQRIAKIEDLEILEQVKQAEAAAEVSKATIRQREADLSLAKTNVERARNLFQRQLLPQQSLDDNEARYQSAIAAVDLSKAQNQQASARLEELHINLENTVISSPVDGFVARRAADPGAFASPNAPLVDVVDIARVRLVVNIVEKDLRQVTAGDQAQVEVDAYPGESFMGRIARVAPVLDPATRTAAVEIEIPNAQYRLKPGMYARVGIVTETHPHALVVPTNALVDVNGTRGVYLALNNVAAFRPVKTGIESNARTEILDGVADGDRVVTTGAAALRNGDPIVLAGGQRGGGGAGGRGGRGGRQAAGGQPQATPDAGANQAGQRSAAATGATRAAGATGATAAASATAARRPGQFGDGSGRGGFEGGRAGAGAVQGEGQGRDQRGGGAGGGRRGGGYGGQRGGPQPEGPPKPDTQ